MRGECAHLSAGLPRELREGFDRGHGTYARVPWEDADGRHARVVAMCPGCSGWDAGVERVYSDGAVRFPVGGLRAPVGSAALADCRKHNRRSRERREPGLGRTGCGSALAGACETGSREIRVLEVHSFRQCMRARVRDYVLRSAHSCLRTLAGSATVAEIGKYLITGFDERLCTGVSRVQGVRHRRELLQGTP
jgi:hypothetical protein